MKRAREKEDRSRGRGRVVDGVDGLRVRPRVSFATYADVRWKLARGRADGARRRRTRELRTVRDQTRRHERVETRGVRGGTMHSKRSDEDERDEGDVRVAGVFVRGDAREVERQGRGWTVLRHEYAATRWCAMYVRA